MMASLAALGAMVLVYAKGWFTHASPATQLDTGVYVWQRTDSPELRASLERSLEVAFRRHFLAAEIGLRHSAWNIARTSLPDELIAGQGLVLRIGASLSRESWQPGEALDRVLGEVDRMVARPAAEFQIDYDSPQRSLDAYLRLLNAIKSRHPDRIWTITALPSWLEEPAAQSLLRAADGVVLQVHSLTLPTRPGHPVVLCDLAAAREAVRKISNLGVPFHVALNTYGCEVYFDGSGRVVDVVSEDWNSPPPPDAKRKSAGISEAAGLANLVAGWKSNPPRGMRGIVWYRLPLESDRRNWQWITWQRVASGTIPASRLTLDVRETGRGAWDFVLSNRGEQDERLPERISPGCEFLAMDGVNGYVADESGVLIPAQSSWPWLAPGCALTIGWIRPVDATVQPFPSIP